MITSVLARGSQKKTVGGMKVYKPDPYLDEAPLNPEIVRDLLSDKKVRKNLVSDEGVVHLLLRTKTTIDQNLATINNLTAQVATLRIENQQLRQAPTRSNPLRQKEEQRIQTILTIAAALINYLVDEEMDEYAAGLYAQYLELTGGGSAHGG